MLRESVVDFICGILAVDGGEEERPDEPAYYSYRTAGDRDPSFVVVVEDSVLR